MASPSPPDTASTGGSPLWTILLILVMLVWGNSFIAIKHVVEHVTPLELVTVRFVPVALTFAALLLPTRGRQVWRLIRAEGWVLRNTLACSIFRIEKSPAYTVEPVALPNASTRRSGLPTVRSGGRSVGGNGFAWYFILFILTHPSALLPSGPP